MAFVLIIFSNCERDAILHVMKFQRMKDIIKLTNNRVNYYDVRRNHDAIKYKTRKSMFEVLKI